MCKTRIHIGKLRNSYKVLIGKPEGKRPVGRPNSRWKNIVKINLRILFKFYLVHSDVSSINISYYFPSDGK
jgi:hypothetical protein